MYKRVKQSDLRKMVLFVTSFFLMATIIGCQVINEINISKDTTDDIPQSYFPIEFTSFDGAKLRATVFQPRLASNETAPVIIQLHAFAISRVKHPKNLISQWLFSNEAAVNLWRSGYWVISLDLRGHGDSEGIINLADPNHEVRDIKVLIDWIYQNIPRIHQIKNIPRIGIIGDSYGAGIALLTSAQDPRVQSIVSANGWYDLKNALAPNNIPKIGWLMTPLFTGHLLNPGHMNSFFNSFYKDTLINNMSGQYDHVLGQRSLRYWCEANQPPKADVLVLQGTRDILFDLNQAIGIGNCLKNTSKDYRILGIQDGHLQPFFQWGGSNTFYHVDNELNCGNNTTLKIQDTIIDWFDYTLLNKTSSGIRIPRVCISTSPTSGVILPTIPFGGINFLLGAQLNADSFRSSLTPKPLISYIGKLWSGPTQPQIFPIHFAEQDMMLLGTPTLTVNNFRLDTESANLFIGIGLLENGKLRIINDQVFPIKSDSLKAPQKISMKPIATEIKKGQQVVCVIYAYLHRVGLNNQAWKEMELEGVASLPIGIMTNGDFVLSKKN